jgi:hypothetical protein
MEDNKGSSLFETFAILAALYVIYLLIEEWTCKKLKITEKAFKRIFWGVLGVIYLICSVIQK